MWYEEREDEMDGVKKVAVSAIRTAGNAFEIAGRGLEKNAYIETIQPSLRSVALGGATPTTSGFVAPSASVIGKVKMGESSSVWYGAVIRGKCGIHCFFSVRGPSRRASVSQSDILLFAFVSRFNRLFSCLDA